MINGANMLEVALTYICIALIIFLALIIVRGKYLFVQVLPLTLFFAAYFIDNLLMALTNRFDGLRVIPSHIWEEFLICNWSGKLYSVIFTLLFLYLSRKVLTKGQTGLTFRQAPGSILPASIVTFALAAWASMVGIASPKGALDIQTLLYLAIMPGLNEELVYRGYMLGILNRIAPAKIRLLGAPVSWGVIVTSLLFGLLHGFWFDKHLTIQVEGIALGNAMFSGLIFAWLRERTGSLVLPVLAHGVEDFLYFFPRMF